MTLLNAMAATRLRLRKKTSDAPAHTMLRPRHFAIVFQGDAVQDVERAAGASGSGPHAGRTGGYSITWSARSNSDGGVLSFLCRLRGALGTGDSRYSVDAAHACLARQAQDLVRSRLGL